MVTNSQMEKPMEAQTTALALPAKADLAAMFRAENGLDPLVKRIADEVRAHQPDVATKKGRDAIASLAFKVARSKTALDDAGKALNEDARKQINTVDAARRSIREQLDALRDEVRKPLDDWEAAEAARVDALKQRLDRLTNAAPAEDTSEAIAAMIAKVEAAAINDTWAEYVGHASIAKDATLTRLRAQLSATSKREYDAAELARLRAEAAARDEAERIRREAEEAERRRIEAEKAEAERVARIEREKQEAAERAAREAEARAKAEAERVQREAEARAEAERVAAAKREAELQRQIEAGKREAEEAAARERARMAAERLAEEQARRKREADQEHRARIITEIAAELAKMAGNATPQLIAEALIEGRIPHCKVVM